jgi:hypothetical protein
MLNDLMRVEYSVVHQIVSCKKMVLHVVNNIGGLTIKQCVHLVSIPVAVLLIVHAFSHGQMFVGRKMNFFAANWAWLVLDRCLAFAMSN